MEGTIYRITCTATRQRYIGKTKRDPQKRWAEHLRELKCGTHPNDKLRAAYRKHGQSSLSFEVVERCPVHRLSDREYYWIARQGDYNEQRPARRPSKSVQAHWWQGWVMNLGLAIGALLVVASLAG